jgi:hypothetical protein
MIKSQDLIDEINTILKKTYPIEKTTFKNICELTHFRIIDNYLDLYLPFRFDINGKILNGKYKSYQIIKVNNYNYDKYLSIYLLFSNFLDNPCISPRFLFNLHRKNKIDILCINTLTIKYKSIQIKIDINYQPKPIIKPLIKKDININTNENHFYFSSFSIPDNKEQIRTELMRLFINRNKYKSIHIHLENNGGGDSSPGQLLVKCLIGNNKEPWMKDVKKESKNGNKNEIIEWDSWHEYEDRKQNYKPMQLLDLDFVPIYDTKYTGKIHLYMNEFNGSASWYTITYLIYGFGSKIKRFTKECCGKSLKFGTISKDSQLVLHGRSSTCSGDGNSIKTNFKDISILCPSIQFHTRSFDEIDWNRFWLENSE